MSVIIATLYRPTDMRTAMASFAADGSSRRMFVELGAEESGMQVGITGEGGQCLISTKWPSLDAAVAVFDPLTGSGFDHIAHDAGMGALVASMGPAIDRVTVDVEHERGDVTGGKYAVQLAFDNLASNPELEAEGADVSWGVLESAGCAGLRTGRIMFGGEQTGRSVASIYTDDIGAYTSNVGANLAPRMVEIFTELGASVASRSLNRRI